MRKRVAALALAALVAFPHAAVSAEPSPAPTLTPIEQYKADVEAYQDAMKIREEQVSAIFLEFNTTVKKARQDYAAALSQSKSASAKYQAKLTLKSAIQSAVDKYDAAILELGPAPIPPLKPGKSARTPLMQKNKKSRN